MKLDLETLRVPTGGKVALHKWPTRIKPLYKSEADYEALLDADVEALSQQQKLLYASSGYALLLIFQGMDAAGKDGAISHVLRGVNQQGCEVHSFKHPSAAELEHDFLWRAALPLPARGRIGVFNRSYYEEVLIVRVHPEILAGEGVPGQEPGNGGIWKGRFHSIVGFEKHLHRNGTRVLKFFLHLSKEEQRKRLLARADEPDKSWKFSRSDLAERQHWHEYQRAYEACLAATSSRVAPWYVVPADDKYNARLIVSRVVIDALQRLKLSYPRLTHARKVELRKIRKELEQ